MPIFKTESIVGYSIGNEVICCDCVTNEEMKDMSLDDIICEEQLEEAVFFCDRCKEKVV